MCIHGSILSMERGVNPEGKRVSPVPLRNTYPMYIIVSLTGKRRAVAIYLATFTTAYLEPSRAITT